MSSRISFSALTHKTIARGPAVDNLLVGLTFGICCMQAINKKKTFANFENCSKRNFGKKVRNEYFDVEIVLLGYFCCVRSLIVIWRYFGMGSGDAGTGDIGFRGLR